MNTLALERSPLPFRRDPPALPGNSFVRALAARVLAQLQGVKAHEVALQRWPDDLVTRAAVAPAMTSVPAWAGVLAPRIIADAIEALGPASAGAQLLREGLVLSFDGVGSISVPGFVAEYGNVGFVAEGQPIPVKQLAATGVLLEPHKLSVIGVLTREMAEGSNGEALIGDVLTKAAGRMLDEVLFDANPGDAARPAGLRYGVAQTPPSTDPYYPMQRDVSALLNALAPVGGAGPYVLVAAPGRAALMADAFGDASNVIVLASSAVINDLLAVAPAALVSALSPDPAVETSKAAQLHMNDAPTAVGSASPSRSLFQTESIAIKVRWPVSWAVRDPRAFAWTTPSW